ncbi:hypothetical protein ACTXT7_013757 [Hymenolepis weldensis]
MNPTYLIYENTINFSLLEKKPNILVHDLASEYNNFRGLAVDKNQVPDRKLRVFKLKEHENGRSSIDRVDPFSIRQMSEAVTSKISVLQRTALSSRLPLLKTSLTEAQQRRLLLRLFYQQFTEVEPEQQENIDTVSDTTIGHHPVPRRKRNLLDTYSRNYECGEFHERIQPVSTVAESPHPPSQTRLTKSDTYRTQL